MKTILITGASSGIGKATAKFFQQKGWNVVATMRNPEIEKELIQLENVFITRLDVLDSPSIDTAIADSISRFGKIDVLVNNAGYGMLGLFESIPKESIQRLFGVNVFGLLDVSRAVLPHFRQNKSGLIINISSNAGKITYPLSSLYHATKFAIEGFSESLHYELEAIGIGVKIVEPGAVFTDYGGRSLDAHLENIPAEYTAFVHKLIPQYQKMVNPAIMSKAEQIAEIIFTAATDETNQLRYIAGDDAKKLLSARDKMNDDEFVGMIKSSLTI
jgi:NADP-dependent 3-hydroxy acid dehydrogenase YdfG